MPSDNTDILNHFFKEEKEEPTLSWEEELKTLTPLENVDELVLIVDRSGSMDSILEDAEGGVNAFIEQQREEGEANITLAEFDDGYNVVYERIPLAKAPKYSLRPRGMTALLDAIGRTMNTYRDVKTTGKKIAVVVTDGLENYSREWDRVRINSLITELKEGGWEFVFLAADEEAIQDAATFGFDLDTSIQMDRSVANSANAVYAAASTYTTSLRGAKTKAEALADMDEFIKTTDGITKKI